MQVARYLDFHYSSLSVRPREVFVRKRLAPMTRVGVPVSFSGNSACIAVVKGPEQPRHGQVGHVYVAAERIVPQQPASLFADNFWNPRGRVLTQQFLEEKVGVYDGSRALVGHRHFCSDRFGWC